MPRFFTKQSGAFQIQTNQTAERLAGRLNGLGFEASKMLVSGNQLRFRSTDFIHVRFEMDEVRDVDLVPFTDIQSGLDVDMSVTALVGFPTRNAVEVERLGGKWVAKRSGLANPLLSWRKLDELHQIITKDGLKGLDKILQNKDLHVMHVLAEPGRDGVYGHFSYIWKIVDR